MRVGACVLLLALCSACTVRELSSIGRPCGPDVPCGKDAVCDLARGQCVQAAARDALPDAPLDRSSPPDTARDLRARDQRPDVDTTPDIYRPDTRRLDFFVRPDAGCPPPLSQCGSFCVDQQSDFLHCGTTCTVCSGASDRCLAGKCSCGASGSPCGAGLNCIGGVCLCVAGPASRCDGCCQGTACIARAGQTTPSCGRGGAPCKSCVDSSACTTDSCVDGSCVNAPVPAGGSCPGGKCFGGSCCTGCWDGTTCQSGATPASCGVGGASCTACPAPAVCQLATCTAGTCGTASVLDGAQCTVSSNPGVCRAGQCCGCIDGAGACHPGTAKTKCGSDGQTCEGCAGINCSCVQVGNQRGCGGSCN